MTMQVAATDDWMPKPSLSHWESKADRETAAWHAPLPALDIRTSCDPWLWALLGSVVAHA
jgi:hypothetical protein